MIERRNMGRCRRAQAKHLKAGAASSVVTPDWLSNPKPLLAFIPAPQRTQVWGMLGGLEEEEADWHMVGHTAIFQIGDFGP